MDNSRLDYYLHGDTQVNNTMTFGGGTPVWRHQPSFRMIGGLLASTFTKGELIHAASPVDYNEKTHVTKILKCFKVSAVSTDGSNTIITLDNTFMSPTLSIGMNVMVAPSTMTGTGKGVLVSAVDTSVSGSYKITVPTASIDAVTVGAFIVESAGAGSGVAMYCEPNTLLANDLIIGEQTTVSIIRKEPASLYRNSMPDLPEVILDNILAKNPLIEFEYLPEI